MELRPIRLRAAGLVLSLLLTLFTQAQTKTIRGYVKDKLSEERIPFASLQFLAGTQGKLTDSAGYFEFRVSEWPTDTLVVTYVGYQDLRIPIHPGMKQLADGGEVLELVLGLERG